MPHPFDTPARQPSDTRGRSEWLWQLWFDPMLRILILTSVGVAVAMSADPIAARLQDWTGLGLPFAHLVRTVLGACFLVYAYLQAVNGR